MNSPAAPSAPTRRARLGAAWRERAAQPGRESRDTLFMLAVLAWTLLPQAPHVPLWCSLFSAAALLWRAVLAWRVRPLPPRWLLILLLLACIGATVLTYRSLTGKEAGLALLVLLTALKTLELRARRDALVLFFLGFFLVLANFLHSQSLATAVAMVLSVWGLLAALVLAHMPVGRPRLAQVAGLAGRMLVLGAPLIAALFIFFPRMAPLWGVPGEAGGRTGLSDQLQLGDVAELALDDSTALRVRFFGPAPAASTLYFRGPVLSLPDGQRWVALPWRPGDTSLALPNPSPRDTALAYEMTVEPLRVSTLPLLETSVSRPQVDSGEVELYAHPDGQWITGRPIAERVRLQAQAAVRSRAAASPEGLLPTYLQLPPGQHPRSIAWAQALRSQPAFAQASPNQLADLLAVALVVHIRQGGYSYTLAPGTYGEQPLDAFWLDRREGFCEHFATAFVVLMRAMGVPARIVTGYQGGQFNPIDGVLEVRQSDAHAWAEYWRAGDGWVRVDPTAAVAPDRIQRSQRLAPPRGLMAGALAQVDPALLARVRAVWGALDHQWNQWVLSHGRQRQLDLLRALGWQSPDLADLGRLLAIGLAGLALLGAALGAWQARRVRQRDPWLRAYAGVRKALMQRGIDCPAHLPPRSLAAALRRQHGTAAETLAAALLALEAWRYQAPSGAATDRRTLGELRRRALAAARTMARQPAENRSST
ncbi:transglutaminase domain protein [Leptothrix cholodnii SP-6]|uniref:Transglutaminase domain protein n=1 Tax=Leptothrix cholodnii (strain ATCC 51168 / LMG 8142 / SP-6) TaxID=395495 RepID=B1XYD4_LEPCP|nr:DUF3488 and transglutaminase-like domain-containing protein [Leptothrix cholodnii]ACB35179.1 transglutaminase domain protein [Leptothrix cholodnii SP-6]